MTLAEKIRNVDTIAEHDPAQVRKLLDAIRSGAVKFQGRPVLFTYADTAELFARQGIDSGRFEELCRLADYVAW